MFDIVLRRSFTLSTGGPLTDYLLPTHPPPSTAKHCQMWDKEAGRTSLRPSSRAISTTLSSFLIPPIVRESACEVGRSLGVRRGNDMAGRLGGRSASTLEGRTA